MERERRRGALKLLPNLASKAGVAGSGCDDDEKGEDWTQR